MSWDGVFPRTNQIQATWWLALVSRGQACNLAGSSLLLSAVGGVLIIAVNALLPGALGIIASEKRGFTFCFE